MDNYKSWSSKGEQYLDGVRGKNGNPCKFSPSIQYNLIALAFESYAMAILDLHNKLPENHTFSDLLNALETVIPIDISLRNNILRHEEVQLICPLFDYHRREPTLNEVNDFKKAINQIAGIARELISKNDMKGIVQNGLIQANY
jgi:hypothetical protein